MHWKTDSEQELITLSRIKIAPLNESENGMVLLSFDKEIRDRYPRIPEALFVDLQQTLPGSFFDAEGRIVDYITYDTAIARLERIGRRLPTADEFEAIAEQVAKMPLNGSAGPVVDGLADSFPEWTSTRYTDVATTPGFLNLFKDLFVIKGYALDKLPSSYSMSGDGRQVLQPRAGPPMPTAYRGVRIARPRLVKLR
jgi:hypothetical protein